MQATMIGFDLAKAVFQAHGVDAEGKVVVKRQLRRTQMIEFFRKLPPCLIGMEACATAHYWARKLTALGHTVRLTPPSYVKAYVRRSARRRHGHRCASRPSRRSISKPRLLCIKRGICWSVSVRS